MIKSIDEIVYCKDCKYYAYDRGYNGRIVNIRCRLNLNIMFQPELEDFCSRGVKVFKCPKCDKKYDELPNFCSKCGEKLRENNNETIQNLL